METLMTLVQKWTDEANHLRDRYGLETAARICEAHVNELEAAVVASKSEILTVTQAAEESGYSEQHLRALIAEGRVANAGQKGRPRIRRSELPHKANGHPNGRSGGRPEQMPSQPERRHGRAFNAHRVVHGP